MSDENESTGYGEHGVTREDVRMTESDRLLSIEELAEFLEVPVRTLYTWRYRGDGPLGFRVGKHVRYRWSDIERWIGDRVREAQVTRQRDQLRATAPPPVAR